MKRKQISAWWSSFGGGAVRIFFDVWFGFFLLGVDEESKEKFLISLRVELERVILGEYYLAFFVIKIFDCN